MLYNKRRLYLVVDEMELCITGSPNRISLLEDYLMELKVPKDSIRYTANTEQFIAFQVKFKNLLSVSSPRKNSKKKS